MTEPTNNRPTSTMLPSHLVGGVLVKQFHFLEGPVFSVLLAAAEFFLSPFTSNFTCGRFDNIRLSSKPWTVCREGARCLQPDFFDGGVQYGQKQLPLIVINLLEHFPCCYSSCTLGHLRQFGHQLLQLIKSS